MSHRKSLIHNAFPRSDFNYITKLNASVRGHLEVKTRRAAAKVKAVTDDTQVEEIQEKEDI